MHCKDTKKAKTSSQFQTTRWADHLIRCEECPLDIRKQIAENGNDKLKELAASLKLHLKGINPAVAVADSFPAVATASTAAAAAAAAASVPPLQPSKKRAKVQTTIESVGRFDHCSKERADKINECIMTFLAGCALPFILVESVFFIRMIKSLNEAFLPHLRKSDAFSTTWLPRLHKKVKKQVKEIWRRESNVFRTLGSDGFTGEDGNKVTIVTESVGPMVAFKKCVVQGEDSANANCTYKLWRDELLESCDNDATRVEKAWAAIVADNTAVNPSAAKLLLRDFPQVFFNGCRSHCADLLVEDIAKIAEISNNIEDVKFMAKFVIGYSKVKAAWTRLQKAQKAGTLPKLFPDTRFACCCVMLESLRGKNNCNKKLMKALIDEDRFESHTCIGADGDKMVTFQCNVGDPEFWERLEQVSVLFKILSSFVHHQETPACRASFVHPLYMALKKDVKLWGEHRVTKKLFLPETISAIEKCVSDRWMGSQNTIGLFAPQFLMAWILDPTFAPDLSELPEDWRDHCHKIIKRFHSSPEDQMQAMGQLEDCILKKRSFGKQATQTQQAIRAIAGAPPPATAMLHVAHEIKHQKAAMEHFNPTNCWRLEVGAESPKLKNVALRLMQMGTQSADVERACKAHKIVHSKIRNRLTNDKVNKLLCCCVNLRLLSRCSTDNGMVNPSALTQADDEMEDFIGQAVVLEAEEAEVTSEQT